MSWFLRTTDYRFCAGLVVQSGTVETLRRCLPRLPQAFGDCPLDLLTCYPRDTVEFHAFHRIWDVREFSSTGEKLCLLVGLRKNYDLVVILASNETIMSRWRLAALLLLAPKKVFAFNENGDGYWLDWPRRNLLWRHLLWRMDRAGFSPLGMAGRSLLRVVLAPLVYLYLFGFAATSYVRRGLRGGRSRGRARQ